MLNPTPLDRMVDRQGRPYFLWDCDMTLAEFQRRLVSSNAAEQAYLIGKLMRQAKPDDVFLFAPARLIRQRWPEIERHLGKTRAFWRWLLGCWERQGLV